MKVEDIIENNTLLSSITKFAKIWNNKAKEGYKLLKFNDYIKHGAYVDETGWEFQFRSSHWKAPIEKSKVESIANEIAIEFCNSAQIHIGMSCKVDCISREYWQATVIMITSSRSIGD